METAINFMSTMTARIPRGDDERGAAIVEYLLLLFLIAIVAMIAVGMFGMANHDKFINVANSIQGA